MGFVTKLLTVFIPIIIAMVFYHQRDHILDKQQNDYLDRQIDRFVSQLNWHVDSIVQQVDQHVTETKRIVEPNENEIDKEEKVIKKPEEQFETREIKPDESKVDDVVIEKSSTPTQGDESIVRTDEETIKPTESMEQKVKQTTGNVKCDLGGDLLISKEQLKSYNGEDPKKKIYLGFLGIVYDVSVSLASS